MNPKILIAFGTGAVLASGIVYMAVSPEETHGPAPVAVVKAIPTPLASTSPASPTPAATGTATAVTSAPSAGAMPVAAPERVPPSTARVREKPSPVYPPPRRGHTVTIARNEKPSTAPPQAAPAPQLPEPINKERPYNDAKPADPQPAPVPEPTPPPTVATPAPTPQEEPLTTSPATEPRSPNTVTIQPGTILAVRIGETISSARNEAGDSFLATLEKPLVVDGFVIAERGARVEGRITEAEPAGRVRGVSHLGIELVRLSTSDGQHIHIRTEPFKKEAASSAGGDLAKIGAGAAIGAAIGAIAGGGKGAAIGAGVGGAAGTADVLLTRGKSAEIPVETRVSFRIQEPLTITERLQ